MRCFSIERWARALERCDGISGADTTTGKPYTELPLGSGGVDFPRYLAALEDIGYKGFLTIEREVGANPAHDIAEAVKFLNNIKQQY